MKSLEITGRVAALLMAGLSLNTAPLFAAETGAGNPDDWQFAGELYIWAPEIRVTAPNGSSISIPFDSILDNLQMTFMGVIAARKDKWTFSTDLLYMDLSDKKNFSRSEPDVTGQAKADMTAWIVSPTAAYNVLETDRARVDLLGGLRYLDIEAKLNLNLDGPRPDGFGVSAKDSFSNWDGVVGANGLYRLNEHWSLRGRADIGAGDSDQTWQVIAMVGYQFNHFELNGGYRYLDYQFDKGDNDLMVDLVIEGPFIGALFRF